MTVGRTRGVPAPARAPGGQAPTPGAGRRMLPEQDAMLITGHRTRSTFDRYSIRNEETMRRAARTLDGYAGGCGARS